MFTLINAEHLDEPSAFKFIMYVYKEWNGWYLFLPQCIIYWEKNILVRKTLFRFSFVYTFWKPLSTKKVFPYLYPSKVISWTIFERFALMILIHFYSKYFVIENLNRAWKINTLNVTFNIFRRFLKFNFPNKTYFRRLLNKSQFRSYQ